MKSIRCIRITEWKFLFAADIYSVFKTVRTQSIDTRTLIIIEAVIVKIYMLLLVVLNCLFTIYIPFIPQIKANCSGAA